jgi:electron transport complex protein RnfB
MSETEGPYRALQRHLDNQPIGFPPTKSGVELRILKHIFTPEEAKIATKLRSEYEPIEVIYERCDASALSLEDLRTILDAIVEKGGIHYRLVNDEKHYANAPLMVGMYEYQLKRLTKEFVDDVFQYAREGFALEVYSTGINQLRIVPVNQSLTEEHIVSTYDELMALVDTIEGPYSVAECVCRKARELQGAPCQQSSTHENCLMFGDMAQYYSDQGWARLIEKEEVFKILKQSHEDGLIFQSINSQKPEAICNCCACCCGLLSNIKQFNNPADFIESNYYAAVDAEKCIGCESCVERCQLAALEMVDGISHVDRLRCIGCGNCVVVCPEEAIHLEVKKVTKIPPEDTDILYDNIRTKKARFLRAKERAEARRKRKQAKLNAEARN